MELGLGLHTLRCVHIPSMDCAWQFLDLVTLSDQHGGFLEVNKVLCATLLSHVGQRHYAISW